MEINGTESISASAFRPLRGVRALLAATLLTLAAPTGAEPGISALHELAVLYATEPGSERADATWAAWVRANPDADIDAAVADVVGRAMTLRSLAGAGVAPARPARRPSSAALSDHLLQVAKAALATRRLQAGTGAGRDGITARASTSR